MPVLLRHKSGIENMLRHYVPEVNDVVQEVEEGSMDLLDMATMNLVMRGGARL